MPISLIFIFFILAFSFTYLMRAYALKKNIIDNPNERSSHSVPTPRGGGVAVVCSYLISLGFLIYTGQLDITIGFTLIGAGSVVALLGFLDDHGHINSMLRLVIHFLIAIGAVFFLGGFSDVTLFNGSLHLGWFANIIAILFLVWLLNLYNFMDGINGIASVEAITTLLSLAFIYLLLDAQLSSELLFILAACVLGFVLWNFPKARIFMGDAGSGFLGLILGILALISLKTDPALFCAWLICLGVFIVDATFTLIRRVINGHKMYDAHRSHAYQYASRKYNSHTTVTIGVLLINVFWLLPIAYLASQKVLMPELLLFIAYMPLILIAVFFGAGKTENA
ncbi:glycosyltransferase family 4 protein [Acinetobacter pittii]|uniref:MraY family glycosyltransferase n=1 Tax=Acinetobacter pittii TaxID=48296 RepID=UPI000CE3F4D7|nr:glycosyltransferase family 4 protein [Acinetobacter pittii]PPB99741.1 glycosyl transferase [Acinetobacter pittii]WPP77197.1 glycosyltransferase family 4 protein [Acinetobacter pittii]